MFVIQPKSLKEGINFRCPQLCDQQKSGDKDGHWGGDRAGVRHEVDRRPHVHLDTDIASGQVNNEAKASKIWCKYCSYEIKIQKGNLHNLD